MYFAKPGSQLAVFRCRRNAHLSFVSGDRVGTPLAMELSLRALSPMITGACRVIGVSWCGNAAGS